ncbi:hypothetical protein ACQPWW_13325 [Micromonospora sp. CA-240977]|uniref:hypothetical protein n=1 Tax=Micromonospora sp. CA-240977 TaxID=3239957 RepID=UPI003D8CB105
MSSELVPAAAGLVGAIIGALASILGTFVIERRRWHREQRAELIQRFVDGLLSGDRAKAVEMKLAFAMLSRPEHIRGFLAATEGSDLANHLNAALLDVINQERATFGLARLSLEDINGLVLEETPETPAPRATPRRGRR